MRIAYRVVDVVTISATIGEDLHERLAETIAILDRLHTLPKQKPVQVARLRRGAASRIEGQYEMAGGVIEIAIHRSANEPRLTFVHEFGHYLDDVILHPVKGGWASHYDEDLRPLMEACIATRPVRAMVRALRRGKPTRRATHYLREMLLPHEIFARVYTQWVVERSGADSLREEFERRLANPVVDPVPLNLEWEAMEFKDIMPSLEELFRRKGLL